MKVCTDACLFGAWLAVKKFPKKLNCLDIGTGTGLLSLIFAQQHPDALIDAAEIESNAFSQASENFLASQWKDRLGVFNTDIMEWSTDKKYDLIFSNPPFYENELRSPHPNTNFARHDKGLQLVSLITKVKDVLDEAGTFAVLLPAHRVNYFEELAGEKGLFLKEKVMVRQTPNHEPFRGMLLFANVPCEMKTSEIIIKEDGGYTVEFRELLKDYYLNL
jgi:tRNA1Val (adenine37-N6)-methyltransferase